VQLWPPLCRRLVDTDAFSRASALAALKAASKVDAPFFTRKVMDQVWPLLSARAYGGDAGACACRGSSHLFLRAFTALAEALSGLADIVRSFPESPTLPAFAGALALWCERRCITLPLPLPPTSRPSHARGAAAVLRWRRSAVRGKCGGGRLWAAAYERALRLHPLQQSLSAPLLPARTGKCCVCVTVSTAKSLLLSLSVGAAAQQQP